MKQIYIGTYPLYHLNVDLFVWPDGRGGRVITIPPGRNKLPAIFVGLDYRQWEDTLSILLHETFEITAAMMGCQYNPESQLMADSASYLFVFDHTKFTQICEHQAKFVAACLPDLRKAYSKNHK